MIENGGFAEEGKDEAIDGSPEVSGVANVVRTALSHIPAVQKVQRGEDIPRNRNGNHENVYAHLRLSLSKPVLSV